MLTLPSPYQPGRAIGQGMNNIAKGIFSMGRMGMLGRRGRPRTQQQNDLDVANARKAQAETRKTDFIADEQQRINMSKTPDALDTFGANEAGLPQVVYNNIKAIPKSGVHAPLAAAGYTTEDLAKGMMGQNQAAQFSGNKTTNPDNFANARSEVRSENDRGSVMEIMAKNPELGEIAAGILGKGMSAKGGKGWKAQSGGMVTDEFSGDSVTNELGRSIIGKNTSVVNKNKSGEDLNRQKIKESSAKEGLYRKKESVGGFAPKSDKNSYSKITKEEKDSILAQIGLRLGDPENLPPQVLADIFAQSLYHLKTTGSPKRGNPNAAADEAMKQVGPDGYNPDGTAVGGRAGIRPGATSERSPKTISEATAPNLMDATNPGGGESYEELRKRLYPNG